MSEPGDGERSVPDARRRVNRAAKPLCAHTMAMVDLHPNAVVLTLWLAISCLSSERIVRAQEATDTQTEAVLQGVPG